MSGTVESIFTTDFPRWSDGDLVECGAGGVAHSIYIVQADIIIRLRPSRVVMNHPKAVSLGPWILKFADPPFASCTEPECVLRQCWQVCVGRDVWAAAETGLQRGLPHYAGWHQLGTGSYH